jgi:5'-nucleotidase
LNDDEKKIVWKEYFDIIIVNATKPNFFANGTTLREVDEKNDNLKFLEFTSFEKNKVYSGGNIKIFSTFTKTYGSKNI